MQHLEALCLETMHFYVGLRQMSKNLGVRTTADQDTSSWLTFCTGLAICERLT